ncbi:cytochrome [Nocardia sp. MH4]|jgi:cytochrome P450|uniref:cytochrome P450 n=1 Tax=Nocardia TaxID=1817 RepID=UPI001C4F3B49|nr:MULTISPECIES: cytochrome P450 [Nocardia]MBW0274386.1 cytochrome [Nocardia sp. MH4]
MNVGYAVRWAAEHGLPRLGLMALHRKGDTFAQLLSGDEGRNDPYTLIDQLRGDGGVQTVKTGYAVFEHGLCKEILRDRRFGVRTPIDPMLPGPIRRYVESIELPPNPIEAPSMFMMDPPEHSRLRKPVASAFTPRAVSRLGDRVREVTTELLDALEAKGSAELISEFAAQVPVAVIGEMLGFPDSDREMFLAWGEVVTPLLDVGISWETHQRAMTATAAMKTYLADHIEKVRRDPGDDIFSTLVTSGELNTTELMASANVLMGAGFETTMNLLGNAIPLLLAHPDQLELLRAEPQHWPNAIEEILRFEPPVQLTARRVLEPVELGGAPLQPGKSVIMSLAGANRDPAKFEDPHRFDVTRANAKEHLAFGSGVHACIGASLARLEGINALPALFERFPDLRLDGEPRRRGLSTLHGFDRMPAVLSQSADVVPASTGDGATQS